jgi:hypothetical protein
MGGDDAIKVAVRVRPFNDREKNRNATLVIEMNGKTTLIKDPNNLKSEPKSFAFDQSYWSHDGFNERPDGYMEKSSPSSNYADQVGWRRAARAHLVCSVACSTILAVACSTMHGPATIVRCSRTAKRAVANRTAWSASARIKVSSAHIQTKSHNRFYGAHPPVHTPIKSVTSAPDFYHPSKLSPDFITPTKTQVRANKTHTRPVTGRTSFKL